MKPFFTILLFSIGITTCFAQNQGNQWYFGIYAGLDFNSGTPVPILTSQMTTYEGSASIADRTTGRLLFYTDGVDVWDSTNTVMPNGTGLGGSTSTTQAAVIVPRPGSNTLYYIFTLDAQAGIYGGSDGGCNLNVVDMSLHGGLGDVTTKDSLLLTPTAEKCATSFNCKGDSVWVVIHQWNSDAFYAYLVTATGLSAPVISHSGIVQKDVGSGSNAEAIGYMHISNDGKKLALTCEYKLNTIQIFDFNNSTGTVSNPITDTAFLGSSGCYGVCFSPDNTKLYATYNYDTSQIYQYNLLAGSGSAIIASRTSVGQYPNHGVGAMQVGPDGKLYVCQPGDTLGIIANPNALGAACNYIKEGLYLGGKQCFLGLPDIIPNLSGTAVVQPPSTNLCSGQGAILTASGGTTYSWSPATGLSATTGDTVIANPTADVTYTVTVTTPGGCMETGSAVISIIPAPNIPVITVSATGDSLISSANSYNQWYFDGSPITDSTRDVLVIKGHAKGFYKVVVTNPANGCSTTSDSTTSINQLASLSGQISVYPNPTSNQITISSKQLQIDEIEVTNVLGQMILLQRAPLSIFHGEGLGVRQTIDLSGLPSDVYFITVINKTGRAVFPVVKQN